MFGLLTLKEKIIIALCVGFVLMVTVGAAYTVGRISGSSGAKVKCAEAKTEVIVKQEKKYEKTKSKVMSRNDADLRSSYCKWVRDDVSACLQKDIPISE
jgi:TRAP-type C4-dicarboxylate transport system permease large subunit